MRSFELAFPAGTDKDVLSPPKKNDRVNGHPREIGFRFPDLWDPAFKAALGEDGPFRPEQKISRKVEEEGIHTSIIEERHAQAGTLRDRFFELHKLADRQVAGRELEGVLNGSFELYGLQPRPAFRVVGEEIDGSFDLDSETSSAGGQVGGVQVVRRPLVGILRQGASEVSVHPGRVRGPERHYRRGARSDNKGETAQLSRHRWA